jgi:hypothetical protein
VCKTSRVDNFPRLAIKGGGEVGKIRAQGDRIASRSSRSFSEMEVHAQKAKKRLPHSPLSSRVEEPIVRLGKSELLVS